MTREIRLSSSRHSIFRGHRERYTEVEGSDLLTEPLLLLLLLLAWAGIWALVCLVLAVVQIDILLILIPIAIYVFSVAAGLVVSFHANTSGSATMAVVPIVLFFLVLSFRNVVVKAQHSAVD